METPNGLPTSLNPSDAESDRDAVTRARLAALVRSSADAIVGETLEGIVTDWNPSAERLYGYRAEEVIGQPLTMLIPPDRLAEAEEILARVHRGEHVADIETERWTKDGRRIDVSLSVSPVWDEAGEITATSAIVRDITEHKATVSALADSEALFRVAFENAPIGMALVSPEGHLLQVNRALCTMLGYSERALRTKRIQEITHPEDLDRHRVVTEGALAGEVEISELEKRYLHHDGHAVWALLSTSPVRDASGSLLYLISQIQDITERKTAEAEFAQLTEQLRVSEEKYRTLVEQLPLVAYVEALDAGAEPDWTTLYVSPQVEALLGYSAEEWTANPGLWAELLHPGDREAALAEDARTEATGEPYRAEYRLRARDGRLVWVRDEAVLVRDAAGAPLYWQGVMVDVTQEKATEAALREAEARYRTLVEQLPGVVYLLAADDDQTALYVSPHMEELTGRTPEEVLARTEHWLEHVHPDDRDRVAAELASGGRYRAEYRFRRSDGSYVWVQDDCVPIRDDAGQIMAWQGVMLDITERKQAEEALRAALEAAAAANQAKSSFLAMMSHELRTPLQAVLGYAESLLADPQASLTGEQRTDIDYIHQGGRRMLTLITQLLDLSRIEAGRVDLVVKPVDLGRILEQVRQDVAPQAIQKGLKLRIDLPPALPRGIGDPERLRQILLNLVGNAVKFTEQGSVHVTAETTADGVAVIVRDTGIGITPEALSHIFEAFRQVDSRLSRRHGGAGLGLAIAQKLAELMDGRISVESVKGEGSTFTLHLAAAPPIQR